MHTTDFIINTQGLSKSYNGVQALKFLFHPVNWSVSIMVMSLYVVSFGTLVTWRFNREEF